MTNNTHKYFTERYVENRKYLPKLIKEFSTKDFEIIDTYHELREFVRQPIQEWHVGIYLPDEILDERDEILALLDKDEYILPENPTKEDNKKFAEHYLERMKTPEWKRWTDWTAKTKGMAKNYPRLEEETSLAKQILFFYKNGRNIFSINPFLVDLLKKTEVGNIRLKDIKLPYKSIYFNFSPLKEIQFPVESLEHKHDIHYRLQDLEKEYLLDGAFVSMRDEYTIDIALTFVDSKDNFNEKISITKDFRFPIAQFALDFGLWDSQVGRTKSLETTFNESTVCFNDIWEAEGNPGELEYEKLHSLIKEKEKCGEFEWEEYVLMDNSLKLIVNCICYLNSVDKDIENGATNKSAEEILAELSKTKKTQLINKLNDKLKKYSYSKIHFCGNKLKEQFSLENSTTELDPHWRRGHWRNQLHGERLKLSKLIWIKPTIVRKDKGQPEIGHIYQA